MPAFSTHYIFAKEMLDEIQKNADFPIDKSAYYIGTQGPDIFFFHRIFPWLIGKSLRALGSKIHNTKPSLIFDAMQSYCKKSDNDIAKSYVCGFILHYALDSTCHPYVYSMQNKLLNDGKFKNRHTAHNIIEFSMDAILLNKHLGIEKPYEFDTSAVIEASNEASTEIAKLYCYIIPKLYDLEITENDVITAINDTVCVQKATLDKSGVKRIILNGAENLLFLFTGGYRLTSFMRPRDLEKAQEYANIEKKPWTYPTADIKSTMSFEELFEQSKHFAVSIINAFINGTSIESITKNKSFLTGVEVK